MNNKEFFDFSHDFAEFIIFAVTIMMFLTVSSAVVALFAYLVMEDAVILFSKAISDIPLLLMLGSFSFLVTILLVLMSISPVFIVSSRKSRVVVPPVNYSPVSGGKSICATVFSIFVRVVVFLWGCICFICGKIYPLSVGKVKKWCSGRSDKVLNVIFLIFLVLFLVLQPISMLYVYGMDSIEVDTSLLMIGLCFSFIACAIYFCSEKSFLRDCFLDYGGLFFMAIALMFGSLSPSDYVQVLFNLSFAMIFVCMVSLKCKEKILFYDAVLEVLVLFSPMYVVCYMVLDILNFGIATLTTSLDLFGVIFGIALVIFALCSWVDYRFVKISNNLSAADKVRFIFSTAVVIFVMVIFVSPFFVRNILISTESGSYLSQNSYVVIKIGDMEFYRDNCYKKPKARKVFSDSSD